ncbi:hypothetical protein AKO1_007809 [Acrasis kona]|uniref:Uncharacterized protein n=1 Tax=Acrasis kona TaxID=1008807 RepID=A0AAW2YPC9_9EUKA
MGMIKIERNTQSYSGEAPSKRTKFSDCFSVSANLQNVTLGQNFAEPINGRQLVCSGKIRRKNNKSLPQDSFQMKWTLK